MTSYLLLLFLILQTTDISFASDPRELLTLVLHSHPTHSRYKDIVNSIKKQHKMTLAQPVKGAFKYAIQVARGERPPPKFNALKKSDFGLNKRFIIKGQVNQTMDPHPLKLLNDTIHLLIQRKTSVVIGTHKNCPTEAMVAAALNKPIIAFNCNNEAVSNKHLYPTFARTQPPKWKIAKFILSILDKYNWNKISLIISESSNWQHTAETLKRLLVEHKYKVIHEKVFRKLVKVADVTKIVEDTYKSTRIYVFLGSELSMVLFLGILKQKNLQASGLYAVVTVAGTKFLERQSEKNPGNKNRHIFVGSLLPEHIKLDERIFQSVLIVSHRKPETEVYTNFGKEVIKSYDAFSGNKTEKSKKILRRITTFALALPLHAAHVYDAVMVYLKAVAMATKGINGSTRHIIQDGKEIFKYIRNSTYESVLGYNVDIDMNGDAEGNYSISSLVKNGANNFSLSYVANFEQFASLPRDHKMTKKIYWINGSPPKAEPPCGFENERCESKVALVAIGIASSLSLVILLVVLMVRHYRYEQKLASLLWKIEFRDIMSPDVPVLKENGKSWKNKQRRYEPDNHYSFLLGDTSESNTAVNECTDVKTIGASPSPKIGSFRGMVVALLPIRRRHLEITRSLKKEMQTLKEMSHENLNRFVGACVEPPSMFIVTEYCTRGSLRDILDKGDLVLDHMFIDSLVFDLIKGMIYLHESPIGYHGNLRTSKCLVDSRWVLKISGFGLRRLRQPDFSPSNNSSFVNKTKIYEKLLWKAPEHLRDLCPHQSGSAKGDVYSFAVILFEMFDRRGSWGTVGMKYTPKEIVNMVRQSTAQAPFRPRLDDIEEEEFLKQCLRDCWQEDPDRRPDFKFIRFQLRPLTGNLHQNIFDNMLCIMEKYATRLEWLVDKRTRQLSEEKRKIENLLLRMLPKSVTDQLKRGETVVPEQYDCVTIYFSDIVGFTEIAACSTPIHVVQLLNDLYTLFDSIIGEYDVYKVETIGDAYMVVSGLPIRNGCHHAGEIASMSLHLLAAIKSFIVRHRPDETLRLRIGIHSGPCAAGVVGQKMPRYCLFGDTVNTASRMESTGDALKIHVSQACKMILDRLGGYKLEERGMTDIKGKGQMLTYFLLDEDKSSRLRRISATARPSQLTEDTDAIVPAEPGPSTSPDECDDAFFPLGIEPVASFNKSMAKTQQFSRDMSNLIKKIGDTSRLSLTTTCPQDGLVNQASPPIVNTDHVNRRVSYYQPPMRNTSRDFFDNHGLDNTDASTVDLLRV